MSEEILKALMQLFAIVAKQDKTVFDDERFFVIDFLKKQVPAHEVEEYIRLFDQKIEETHTSKKSANLNLTSVKDSVTILKICMKINKTLDQKQKIIVILRLLEMVKVTSNFSDQRMSIIHTTAEVFNIDKLEFNDLLSLVNCENVADLHSSEFLIISGNQTADEKEYYQFYVEKLRSVLLILRIKSVNMLFLRFWGEHEIFLNGLPVEQNSCTIFNTGSALKLPTGKPIYFSDIYSKFIQESSDIKISFNASGIKYSFANGSIGVQRMSISEHQNTLVGIMGSSGAGKSTLLNILAGITKPEEGNILINGIDLFGESHKLEGVIGFIPQDDLLIENLSVYDNLYYNAKFCFKDKSPIEIDVVVNQTLSELKLYEIRNLRVGSVLNKTISGGQRKRLNIALELMRQPSILFVDEPTSGLSSSDSENVMDLLRELTMKGKLIFVVIHQPSSDIYKLFDKIIVLDEGGYMIQYGNPVETISYFKKHIGQAGFESAQCPSCGNVNPEQLFTIIQSEVVDEYGNYTGKRKIKPLEWHEIFVKENPYQEIRSLRDEAPKSMAIPSKIKQWWIYLKRDLHTKFNNRQYLLIALLEAPVLGIILSFLIKYVPEGDVYNFRANENLPQYIFMSVIVALFLGLTISAEEIFKDRKILKREAFLNLSKSSYLLSKVAVLLLISALQSLFFVWIGNFVLDIKGMYFAYWMMFFSVSFFANILGLNISSAFDSVITIYILIPLLIIPQMILGGAMFSFDKLNKSVVRVDKVPMVAEFMTSKWAYEGLMVEQFKNNNFETAFYDIEKIISFADYHQVYYVPELSKYLSAVKEALASGVKKPEYIDNIELLKNERIKQSLLAPSIEFKFDMNLTPEKIDAKTIEEYNFYLQKLDAYYAAVFMKYNSKKEGLTNNFLQHQKDKYYQIRNEYHNEAVGDIVTKLFEKHKIINYKNQLIQHVDPIYQDPVVSGIFDFRSHLYAPRKHFLGKFFETFSFNISIIWLMSLGLFFTLRFDLLRKLLKIKLFKLRKTKN